MAYADQKHAGTGELETAGTADGKGLAITTESINFDTATDDEEGRLVFADGKLVAVHVRLSSEVHGDDGGSWFTEAGFGPCDPPARMCSSRSEWPSTGSADASALTAHAGGCRQRRSDRRFAGRLDALGAGVILACASIWSVMTGIRQCGFTT